MKKVEQFLGVIGIILVIILGGTLLKTEMLFFRLLVGAGLGYTLSRAFTGFAGSVNRAYRAGSAKLMRAMMFMFFITALLVTAFLLMNEPTDYSLWINPINLGLFAGGFLFGFGMSLSACCATGVLTDLVTALPRAFITLVFFGIGIFLGFPIQRTAGWVQNSWFSTATGEQFSGGVFLPDWFKWDGLQGYLGALILMGLLCGIVVILTYAYEKKRKVNNTYLGVDTEKMQEEPDVAETSEDMSLSAIVRYRLFEKPWTLKQGAVVLSVLFALLLGVTKAGWGASTPYGLWVGRLLVLFGVPAESLASFTKMAAESFTGPFFEHAVTVQNIGIIIGTLIFLLTAGLFKKTVTSELKISLTEAMLFVLGGLTMGFGTRLSNGCNVGALYTPIASFSLSGWGFFIFMIIGGIVGNLLVKRCSCKK